MLDTVYTRTVAVSVGNLWQFVKKCGNGGSGGQLIEFIAFGSVVRGEFIQGQSAAKNQQGPAIRLRASDRRIRCSSRDIGSSLSDQHQAV